MLIDLQVLRGGFEGLEKRIDLSVYGENPIETALLRIQQRLKFLLGVTVIAYGGSLALYLQGVTDRFGDLDVYTNGQFTLDEVEDRLSMTCDTDGKGRSVGWQIWRYNLDIFFTDSARAAAHMELGRDAVVQLDNGIYVHEKEYVMNYNWFFLRGDKKRRIMREPAEERKKIFDNVRTRISNT